MLLESSPFLVDSLPEWISFMKLLQDVPVICDEFVQKTSYVIDAFCSELRRKYSSR